MDLSTNPCSKFWIHDRDHGNVHLCPGSYKRGLL